MNDELKTGNDSEKKESNMVVYIGNDVDYFQYLQKEILKKNSTLNLEFKFFDAKTIEEQQSLVVDLPEMAPKVVFIDYSTQMNNYVHMTRLIDRMNFVRRPSIIGFSDLKDINQVCQRVTLNGVKAVHVKSDDCDPIVFDMVNLAFPNQREDHEYAKAGVVDRATILWPGKLSYLNHFGMHIEANFNIKAGMPVQLVTRWNYDGIIPSAHCVIAEQTQENLYYNFNYAYDVAFEYIPPAKHYEDDTEEERAQREQDRQIRIMKAQNKLKKWLKDNEEYHKPKILKVLVVDKKFSFLQDRPRTDSYNFLLRTQPYIKDMVRELTKMKPNLIIFEMEEVSKEDLTNNADIAYIFNEIRSLKYMISTIQKMKGYNPFVIVFNAKNYSTDHLQKTLNYSQLMVHKGTIDPEIVLKMTEVLNKKMHDKLQAEEEDDDDFLILDKDHPYTYVELTKDVTIHNISELDLFFACNDEIPVGTVLHFRHPISMYVTVAHSPQGSAYPNDYYGLIHGVGEDIKQDLRKYINSIFFKEKEEQKKREKEEFEEAKKKYQAEAKAQKDQAENDKAQAEKLKAQEEEEEKRRREQEKIEAASKKTQRNNKDG
jgi:hypothetical protein